MRLVENTAWPRWMLLVTKPTSCSRRPCSGEAAAAAGVGGLELLPATTDGQSTLVQAAASDELLPGGD